MAVVRRLAGQCVDVRDEVWGYDYAGETRTVDVHVHWLRAAIESDPSDPRYLRTVRGVGYVLRVPEA